jgi:lipoyl-dependent peroxiredoxin
MIRKARALWRGSGRDGIGNLSTESGVLANTAYSFRTRFESEKGTNPEELLAAAHAGCFTMALAFRLQRAGYTSTELNTEAVVTAGWDACMASVARPATQARLKAFRELGFHKPGDAEDRLGFYLERLAGGTRVG